MKIASIIDVIKWKWTIHLTRLQLAALCFAIGRILGNSELPTLVGEERIYTAYSSDYDVLGERISQLVISAKGCTRTWCWHCSLSVHLYVVGLLEKQAAAIIVVKDWCWRGQRNFPGSFSLFFSKLRRHPRRVVVEMRQQFAYAISSESFVAEYSYYGWLVRYYKGWRTRALKTKTTKAIVKSVYSVLLAYICCLYSRPAPDPRCVS